MLLKAVDSVTHWLTLQKECDFCVSESEVLGQNCAFIQFIAGVNGVWLTVFVNQVSKKYVSKELAKEIHAKAAPFLKWLKEAEEESEGSEEEEEEEEDENVEVSDRYRLDAGLKNDESHDVPAGKFETLKLYIWSSRSQH